VHQAIDEENAAGEILLTDHLSDAPDKAVLYARYLAAKGAKPLLVLIDRWEAKIIDWQGDSREDAKSLGIIAETEDLKEGLLAALEELQNAGNNLLINIDRSYRDSCAELIKNFHRVTVASTSQADDVINSYKLIKWLVNQVPIALEVSLFICEAQDTLAAEKIWEKLAQTAKRYLGIDLGSAGYNLSGMNPPAAAAGKNEGQTAASSPGLDTDGDVGAEPPQPARLSPAHLTIYTCIEVEKYPTNDDKLADELQLALPGWLNMVPTALAVPLKVPEDIAPAGRVLLDATGRAYILLARCAAEEVVWAQARSAVKWLDNNLERIAGTCRQLKIDQSLPVGLILVTGGRVEHLREECQQTADLPDSIILQLLRLKTAGGPSLLVI